ncbi:unnamed protein product [Durusdinium trenchii]|uniref:Uncharacterized protein n=1 Tax=Durusdinium trenchii TaxID=1381693 RepID=A0ABP0NQ69_9DINO
MPPVPPAPPTASTPGGAGALSTLRSTPTQRCYSQQHRVAVNAEGRFLAHWDEFVEHRKEVQAKLEEAFEMASERREAGLRLAILCQQLETKVERLARQSKDQLSNGEILEDRLSSQAKSVEACKEAIEVLRDKIQRQVQDLNASLVSVKTELSEEVEKQHQSLQEAMRRGDRCLAEEFFRKLQETSEKLSGNMQVLEDALASFVQQTRVQLADLTEQQQVSKDVSLKLAAECSKMEAQITSLQEDVGAQTLRIDAAEAGSLEQVRQLQALEFKFTKLQDTFARFDGRAAAAEEAAKQRAAQVLEQIREAKDQSAAALLRARSELMDSIAEASSAMKNESKEALRAAESTMASDLQALREEHRKSFTSNVERQQLLVDELRVEITEAVEQSRSNGRDLLALIEELQGQFLELRTESRRSWEEMAARVRAENQANVEDFKAQLRTLRLELGEARKASKVSAEELRSLLDESSASWRRSLVDASALTAKAQTAADEANAECARLHSLVEASCEEKVVAASAAWRQALQEQRLEVMKQLDPIKEKLSEVAATMHTSRRTEAELGSHFERLLVTTEELCAGQEALSAQGADTAQSLNDLRTEIRNVGSSQELNVKPLASPRILRRNHESGRLELFDSVRGSFGAETLLRSPDEPTSHDAAKLVNTSRSLQSSPEKSHVQSADVGAFSRLGELRRRLAAPVTRAQPSLTEPTTGGPRVGSTLDATGRLASI